MDFGHKMSGQDGRAGGAVGRSAPAWVLAQFGRFLPVKVAGDCKTVAGAYFRGRGACTQYDPKVILGAKTLDPTGDSQTL